jgi:hypothetical protein
MFSMLITVPNRTSTAIEELKVDALNSQAYVKFKNGNSYAYENVSKRAIVNVLFNPDVSLGFWVNNNLVKSERTRVLGLNEFNYQNITSTPYLKELETEVKLPEFV